MGSGPLFAQDINENNFTRYTKEQGLSNNLITGVAQDSTGYIWLSTAFGLNRFNGSSFVQFHSNDDSLSLPSENIGGLEWLDKRRLAAYGEGLHIIDTYTGETRNLFIPYKNKQFQYKFNWIMSVRSNSAGSIFILTRSGFYEFDKEYNLVFRFDYYSDKEVATSSFVFGRYLLTLDENHLSIISSSGIYYFDIAKKQLRKMGPADCPPMAEFLDYPKRDYQFFQQRPGRILIVKSLEDSAVYVDIAENIKNATRLPFQSAADEFDYRSEILTYSDTILYITGNTTGFYKIRLDPGTGEIQFYPKKYFPSYSCRHLLKDRDQNLWIATNEGLIHEDNNRNYIRQAAISVSIRNMFPNLVIDDIDAVGDELYVATRGKGGILVFDKDLQFIRRIGFEKCRRQPDHIYSIASAGRNSLLVGTNGPLFRVNTETGEIKEISLQDWDRTNGWIADLSKDRNGNIWVATDSIYKYETQTGKTLIVPSSNRSITSIELTQSIHEDGSGNMWMAGHGLLRYNTSTKSFDRLVDSFPFIKIPDRQVNSFIADNQDNLWINSNNNGLVCYNIDRKTFRVFTPENGLPGNNVASMIILRNKLWMATFSGVACLDLQTSRITSFGKEDGFPDEPISIGAKFFYDSARNKLYIGFINTLVQFDPGMIFQKTRAPKLYVESLMTGDQKKYNFPGESFKTSWRNNDVVITLGTINFLTTSTQRFAYRLVQNENTQWQPLGTNNTFSISNLSPGRHRIQLKLYSSSNRWPEQAKEFEIMITPPFWKQTWFIELSVVILFMLVYLILKWRTGQIRRKERAKTHIEKLKAEEYKNQYELEQITHYFSSSLADKKSVDEVLWDVSRNLIGRMHYEDCMIYLWNDDKTRMIQKASYGPKGNPKAITANLFDVMPGQGVVGHVMQTREPLLDSGYQEGQSLQGGRHHAPE